VLLQLNTSERSKVMAERYYTMYSKYYRNILAVNGRYKKVASSNTVDGRYCCFNTFVLPSLRSGKQYADLIIALRLCCLAPFGAYRKR